MMFRCRLVLAFTLILLSATACMNIEAEKVDYGPKVSEDKVYDALDTLYAGSHPENTLEGAGVHFETTQNIGGGAYKALISDTVHKVIKRSDEPGNLVRFEISEYKSTYRQNNKPETLQRDFELVFAKPAPALSPVSTKATAVPTTPRELLKLLAQSRSQSADEPMTASYHRVRVWEDQGPPPLEVARRVNCSGVPDCRIRYRHVSFDIVYWNQPGGDRLLIELVSSPDIPQTFGFNMSRVNAYIPGLMKSCLTQMVPIGEGEMNTLLTECQETVNFVLGSTPK